jgi:muramoyltetrapeptide carboxypeptidase
MPRHAIVKPQPLRPGDTVGIVAPSSNIQKDQFRAGCDALRLLGYKPYFLDSIFERELLFAGSLERRLEELRHMFEHPDVRAIVCARGGYGAGYVLERIDPAIVRKHPKIFLGYSDVTNMLTWLHDTLGLVTFHGPMVAKDFAHADGVDLASWQSALGGAEKWSLGADSGITGLRAGRAIGVLYGGCLSLLVAALGTKFEPHFRGRIAFIEDIAAKPYQIDRMLTQLALAGKFAGVRGFVFGEMLDCTQPGGQDYSLQDVVMNVLRRRCPGVPVAFGLRSGHVSHRNITLPIGVEAQLEVTGEQARLTSPEPAVPAASRRPASRNNKAKRARAGKR